MALSYRDINQSDVYETAVDDSLQLDVKKMPQQQ
jgi:hypothetical protein